MKFIKKLVKYIILNCQFKVILRIFFYSTNITNKLIIIKYLFYVSVFFIINNNLFYN